MGFCKNLESSIVLINFNLQKKLGIVRNFWQRQILEEFLLTKIKYSNSLIFIFSPIGGRNTLNFQCLLFVLFLAVSFHSHFRAICMQMLWKLVSPRVPPCIHWMGYASDTLDNYDDDGRTWYSSVVLRVLGRKIDWKERQSYLAPSRALDRDSILNRS